jgi:hypothetical protein
MLQRLLTASILASSLLLHRHESALVPLLLDGAMGLLMVVGLWTPVVGIIIAGRGLWTMFLGSNDPRVCLAVAVLGISLAMIGPGAWSIDALLFGRKELKRPR